MPNLVKELYEPYVLAARALVQTDPGLRKLTGADTDPVLLERFLVEYCAHGVKMTRPVEGWIRRAGERSLALGFTEVGQQLVTHAKHEAGHDAMFVEDTRTLVARWNKNHPKHAVNADALLAAPAYAGTQAYVKLHEDVIASPTPYAQVAIEFEIENLSLVLGGPMLANIGRVCGQEVLDALTFLKEHNELDVGHTALNQVMMEKLLQKNPEAVPVLGKTGADALHIYIGFMNECLASAEAALRASAA